MMSSKLVQIFAGAMVVLIFLMFATQPEHKPLKSSVLGFKVLESDALFFKNLRQFYYDKEFHEDAGYELFRHPDQKPLDSHEPRLVILNNWLMDEAYIMFENKDGSSIHAKLRVKNEGMKLSMIFKELMQFSNKKLQRGCIIHWRMPKVLFSSTRMTLGCRFGTLSRNEKL